MGFLKLVKLMKKIGNKAKIVYFQYSFLSSYLFFSTRILFKIFCVKYIYLSIHSSIQVTNYFLPVACLLNLMRCEFLLR